jgi:hypothetical protein
VKGQVALVHEQGQDFAILLVKTSALRNPTQREELMAFGMREFGVRTALLGEDGQTWGPADIVRWLEGVVVEQLPWRDFTRN